MLQLQPHQTVKLHLIVPLVQSLGTVLSTGLVPGNEGDRKQGLFFFFFFALEELTLWLRRKKEGEEAIGESEKNLDTVTYSEGLRTKC